MGFFTHGRSGARCGGLLEELSTFSKFLSFCAFSQETRGFSYPSGLCLRLHALMLWTYFRLCV